MSKDNNTEEVVRLVKVVAECGFASRRKCEKAIESGRVRVNNEVILDPAYRVKDTDEISIDRQIIERQTKRYIALYKPIGVVSTTAYVAGRRTITEFFKNIKERLFYAGRLDSESRGIMIITNDGEFANIITHPSYEILKVYDVVVNGKIDSEKLLNASKGITIKNVTYSPFKFKILSKGKLQSKIRMTINEGKNREIRKIFDFLGYKVIDLERISVGCVSKYNEVSGTLEAGHIRNLTEEEIAFFFNQKDKKLREIENIFDEKRLEEYYNNLDDLEEDEEVELKQDKKEEPTRKHNKSAWAKAKPKKKKPISSSKKLKTYTPKMADKEQKRKKKADFHSELRNKNNKQYKKSIKEQLEAKKKKRRR